MHDLFPDTVPLEQALPPPLLIDGKDELNLAEFPLSSISDRLDPDQKTMVFEDRIYDERRGEVITRKLTITASDQYGLPTALDDEVMLALVQVSKLQKFTGRKMSFSRSQIIAMLGWGDSGRSYERLETALNRWVGVTLYYEKAWWDKANKCWRDEKFHILDNVSIISRDSKNGTSPQLELPLCFFTWNDVIWRSFDAGNLKSIDFSFFVELSSAIAKRLYRFLDKRFFLRGEWKFEIKELCFEHIGLSRNYDVSNLKRKLKPALDELEAKGFIVPLPTSERFRRTAQGIWHIFFHKARQNTPDALREAGAASPLVLALKERGVALEAAESLVSQYPADLIAQQMMSFDFLMAQKDRKIIRNPAGYLVSAIRAEYAKPPDLSSEEDRQRKEVEAATRKTKREAKKREAAELEKTKEAARQRAIDGFWRDLPEGLRATYEKQALDEADAITNRFLKRDDEVGRLVRQDLLDKFVLKMMSAG
ncbi:MAG: Replication initiator protein [Verrucomicrobiales bacterium]|nr:Replication initiator protein [Verrucomicrobiales bacterium]